MVSLWSDHATTVGQELLDNADKFPIVAIKSLKVGDFQGSSLYLLSSSLVIMVIRNIYNNLRLLKKSSL